MQRWLRIVRGRGFRLSTGLVGIAVIAWADRRLNTAIPLALLYLAPMALMSTVLRLWQIPLLGLLCTGAAEFSDAFAWTVSEGIPRDALYLLAYTATGLYVQEALSRRRAEQLHTEALEAEIEARRGAEEQLRLVVANSSIAILTCDETGTILQANDAAERLFAGEGGAAGDARLEGSRLEVFLPALARVQIRRQGWEHLKTMLQSQGLRQSQEPFLANVWVSSYASSRGGRLTAMIVDASREMRDREEANLEQVLEGSRLALGGVFHEIRNICAAIAVVQQNLRTRYGGAAGNDDFEALGQLVRALERMASLELSLVKRAPSRLRLEPFLRELRMILAPSLRESGIGLEWRIEEELPEVWADPQSLLQVFLNLVRNAERALAAVEQARLCVRAERAGGTVQVTVSDNGPGVRRPEQLFRPFGGGANSSGLGLYLSRAMMTSFHGELQYRAGGPGATFVVEMLPVEAER